MERTITYHQTWKLCGKPRCRKCREGQGHGPYWYAYEHTDGGKTIQRYVGPHLPPGVFPLSHIGRLHPHPLIGREAEREALSTFLRCLEQPARIPPPSLSRATQPHCAVLVGEAGIGKTRLVEELGQEAQGRGWAIAWSRVYAQESSIPYRQWIEVLRHAMKQGLVAKQEIRRHPHLFQPLRTLLPELHSIVSLADSPESASPEQEQLRLWETIATLLGTLSKRRPLLLVLDDMQWADSRSCELFGYLARHLAGQAIAIIGTYRDGELPAHAPLRTLLDELRREQVMLHLPLDPLSREQIAALVAPLPQPAVQHIQVQAAGNPFFAEELARGIRSMDEHTPDTAEFGQPERTHVLPDTIAAVLDIRIERLSRSCQQLLSTAAVLGSSFEYTTLVQMEATAVGEDAVLDLIDEAVQSGVLSEERTGPRITYHFWHPLLASYLYERLSAARRAYVHRRAATLLQQVYHDREDEGAATITRHLVEGGSTPEQIIYYAKLAGNRAYVLSAYSEAEYHYRLAVEQCALLQEQPTDDITSLIALLEHLGECLMIRGRYEEARQCYEREFALLTQVTQHGDNGVASGDEAQRSAMVWGEIAWSWRYTGDVARSQQCREQGEALLRAADVKAGPAWASLRYQYSNLCWQEGRYDEALVAAQEALTWFEQQAVMPHTMERTKFPLTRIQRTLAGDPVDRGRIDVLLAAIAATVGQHRVAIAHLQTAIAVFEQYNRQREMSIANGNLGDLHLRMAEYTAAEAAFRRSLDVAERIGDVPIRSVGYGNLGVVALRRGALREAEALLRQAFALAQQINDAVYMSIWQSYLARVLFDQHRFEEAAVTTLLALQGGRHAGIAPCIGSARVMLGGLQLQRELAQQDRHGEAAHQWKRQNLLRAKATFARILDMDGIEAETRIEAQLALAQCLLFLGEIEAAQQLTRQSLEAAHTSASVWLVACADRLLGSIHVMQAHYSEAEAAFEQAVNLFRTHDMHLELADTLQQYGEALVHRPEFQALAPYQAEAVLKESRLLFHECLAQPDHSGHADESTD